MTQPDVLYHTNWITQHDSEVDYTSIVTETMPVTMAGARFVRIQAHDGDLLVSIGTSSAIPKDPSSGSLRVPKGSEIFQLDRVTDGDLIAIKLKAVTGTVHGAVLWSK